MSVSILLCCHNGVSRLAPTLAHLLAQADFGSIEWEIVVVDNASTDGTLAFARESLECAPVPCQFLAEPRPGKTHALLAGLAHCRHEFISIVDDDNWVCPRWVRLADDFMRAHPEVGVVGSCNEPVFEGEAPGWFGEVCGTYACGHTGLAAGDVTDTIGFAFGAGAIVRKSAWQALHDAGFAFYTSGHRASDPSVGEDVELSLALRAAGWRIWYEPALRLQHFMPAARLAWSTALHHACALGSGDLGKDPYYLAPPGGKTGLVGWLRQTWQWQAVSKLRVLCRHGFFPTRLWAPREGDVEALHVRKPWGALVKILRTRGRYTRHIRALAHAPWRTCR